MSQKVNKSAAREGQKSEGNFLNGNHQPASKNATMKTVASLLLVLSAWQASLLAQGVVQVSPLAAPVTDSPPPAAAQVAPDVSAERLKAEAQRQAAIHSKWNIGVDVQMVAVEEGKALDLIPELQSGEQARVEAAWTKLQAMIKAREATLLGWPMVRLVDGTRSVSESILEQRYPTEFEPPPPTAADAATAAAAKPEPKPSPEPKPVDEKATLKNIVPVAFETRNLGTTLEVEATVLDEGKRIHLDLVPQRVELISFEKNESVLDHGKTTVQALQPLFGTSKTVVALTVRNGERQLIGVHKLTKPAGYIELHLVRAVVMKSE